MSRPINIWLHLYRLDNLIGICAYCKKPAETKTKISLQKRFKSNAKCDSTAANEKEKNINNRVRRSDVPFHFKAHHVNASVSPNVRLIWSGDNFGHPSQPDSAKRVGQNATVWVIIALCVCTPTSVCLHHKYPEEPEKHCIIHNKGGNTCKTN